MESKTKQPVFPWYRERLQAKYLKAPDNKLSSIRCWRFTNTSLCSSMTPGVYTGVSPLIFPGTEQHNSSQKPRKSISKEHACFSKQMIQKQIRSTYVASVEDKLKQHPLAMYPHYKDHLTPELFNRVVAVLDPDLSVSNASALPAPSEDLAEEEVKTGNSQT
ncbi:putative protein FAM47D [Neolamprologus brichardi]|uniref:putative protein FAM47D n=1 Tax=Neolamprologus brichardi TaxID=32507 RepID=UPI0016437B6A|nr:putative protein FAM47D [Neolamprologus brichardi]